MLEEYAKRRKFAKTPEPKPKKIKKSKGKPVFVVQKHFARNLHYDFRLEINGVLKSWAVPKGIPKKSNVKVLAIETEDHPIEYAKFKGKIPEGEYGAGVVKIWDKGNFEIKSGSVDKGHLQIILNSDKLKGEYNLIKFKSDKKKKMWLLFKKK